MTEKTQEIHKEVINRAVKGQKLRQTSAANPPNVSSGRPKTARSGPGALRLKDLAGRLYAERPFAA
ncbi:hypothetical protein, partial [Ensifer sp. M14]|uniref:hypothetical protein n=1 Tax=Ensifer sp. M14 TaxID=2203782 RepID=UPI001A7E134C